MLILAGVNVEVTAEGTRHILCFGSPRAPGVHYKVETDAGTVARLQTAMHAELRVAMSAAFEIEDEDEDRDPAHRF